jgi:hypothetical protein
LILVSITRSSKKITPVITTFSSISKSKKKELCAYFNEHYSASELSSNSSALATTTLNTFGARAGPINFAAFDQGSDDEGDVDELNTYFDAPRVPIHMDPVQW